MNCIATKGAEAVTDGMFADLGNSSSVTEAREAAERISAMLGVRETADEKSQRMRRYYAAKKCTHCIVCWHEYQAGEPVYRETRHGQLSSICAGCRSTYRRFLLPRPCGYCERPVHHLANKRTHKDTFCCDDCQVKARTKVMHERRVAARGTRTCATCDEVFEPARADAKFCSVKCKQVAYRRRVTGANCQAVATIPIRNTTDAHSSVMDANWELRGAIPIRNEGEASR